MNHPLFSAGKVAVITGGASGIGFAAAEKFLSFGMKVAIADWSQTALDRAATALRGKGEVMTIPCDVSKRGAVMRLRSEAYERFGAVHVLMNNAGIGPGGPALGDLAGWERVIGTNLWGVIHGVQVFVPEMLARGEPGLVINTGSKQGITTPPGDTAYNVSKAGVKVLTEALAHELRNREGAKITAHLLIPGFVWTDLTAGDRTEKPAGAWTPAETIDFMLSSLERGDFYILCPDNEVDRKLDEKRILWAAGDIVENRPPLSRWHPDYAEAFKTFVG